MYRTNEHAPRLVPVMKIDLWMTPDGNLPVWSSCSPLGTGLAAAAYRRRKQKGSEVWMRRIAQSTVLRCIAVLVLAGSMVACEDGFFIPTSPTLVGGANPPSASPSDTLRTAQ